VLFSFKGITGAQFKTAVQAAKNYEDVGTWLLANGTKKTPAEIKTWSDEVEAGSMMKNPEKRASSLRNARSSDWTRRRAARSTGSKRTTARVSKAKPRNRFASRLRVCQVRSAFAPSH
jgi:hypothetical protein